MPDRIRRVLHFIGNVLHPMQNRSNGRPLQPPVRWLSNGTHSTGSRRLIYRGPLTGDNLRLHYGFDGWQGEPRDVPLIRRSDEEGGGYVAEISDIADHLTIDFVVTDGEQWDNNASADYRLWLTIDPFDAHLHVSGLGEGSLGLASLRAALWSAGISGGVASWPGNPGVARTLEGSAGLRGLVWVRPGVTPPWEVRRFLRNGFVGLKFHPTIDEYRPDQPEMDPYLEVAARTGVPVAIHSAPGDADPDHIRRLAERWPEVPILLYHTYLGPSEGRWRAADHAREQPNLYLETSWCRATQVLRLIDEVGPEKVIFGSDASVDGTLHYRREPPNVEGRETYNEGLVRLVRSLDPRAASLVMGDTARRLFRVRNSSD